ncbi:MAG: hypothetical protein AAB655_00550 [Patescibacteria group bacterium]
MDIFAHGLWAAAAAKSANIKLSKRGREISVVKTAFWGVFPDLFAFTIPFIWLVWNLVFGNLNLSDIPRPENIEPAARDTFWVFNLSSTLYNISHSAIIFGIVFFLIYLILKRPVWEMSGWLLHVLIDIPTHSYRFYPTPVLWPISEWKFLYGFSWGVPWFIILNYSALAIVYIILSRIKKARRVKEE